LLSQLSSAVLLKFESDKRILHPQAEHLFQYGAVSAR
jgi:hypothetical protein